MTTNVPNAKISKVENKIPDHAKYVTNQEFIKLTREMFAVRLKQANSVHKIDFDNKLIRSNRRFSWNNAKYLEDQKKLNSLIRTDYNFSLGWIYFITNDGSQNTFVYQSTLDSLGLKKAKVLIIFLVANQREYVILNLSHFWT